MKKKEKPEEKRSRLHVSLPLSLKNALVRHCNKHGISQTDLVESVLSKSLRRN